MGNGPFWALAFTLFLAQAFVGGGQDFYVYWRAGEHLLAGRWELLYDPQSLTPFKYHPLLLIPFAPLSALPFSFAQVLWALVSAGCAQFSAMRLARVFSLSPLQSIAAMLLVVHGLVWQLKFGNVTLVHLALLLVVASGRFATTRSLAFAGLVLCKPFWIVLLVPLRVARDQKTILLGLALLLLGCVAPFVIFYGHGAELLTAWKATLAAPLHAHNYPKHDNVSWFGFVHRFVAADIRTWVWAGGASLFAALWLGAVLWRRRGMSTATLVASAVPPILWIGPLTWIHNELWLLPLFLGLLLETPKNRRRAVWGLCAAAWLLLNGTGELFWGRAGYQELHRLGVPLVAYVLLLGALFLLPKENARAANA